MSRTTQMSWYQKKHSTTHTYHGHQSSLICFLHLLRSMASSLFNLRAWQPFSTISLQVFFGLPLGLATQLHTPYISSPNLLFAAHAHTIATCFAIVILVSLSTLYLELYLVASCHTSIWPFHLCPLECHIIFLSYGPGLTSMQHTTLHTTIKLDMNIITHTHIHIRFTALWTLSGITQVSRYWNQSGF